MEAFVHIILECSVGFPLGLVIIRALLRLVVWFPEGLMGLLGSLRGFMRFYTDLFYTDLGV